MDKIRNHRLVLVACLWAFLISAAQGAGGLRFADGILTRSWEYLTIPESTAESDGVDRFLVENRALLGLSENPAVELELIRSSEIGAGERLVYGQTAYGLPVFEAGLTIVRAENNIISLFNALSPSEFQSQTPAISTNEALLMAERSIVGKLYRDEPDVVLGYAPDGRMIYRLRLPGLNPPADWEIWMDASNGEVIRHQDRRIFEDGAGDVFDPDPITVLEDPTLQDMNDSNAAIPLGAYSTIVLNELDPAVGGYYHLDGPFVNTGATSNRAAELTTDFNYLREDDRFEEVMVYYHIDHTQRYFQDQLQVFYANNSSQSCNVNGTEEDNSWYSSYNDRITYGSGGVDDAEDADVIIHEYGHAVQDDIIPLWGGGHTGAMGEGYGDYLAGSYSLTVNSTFQPNWVFNWDGHNQFWPGRILNAAYHYPENAGGQIHVAG